jgi:uncharacterized membrane protein
MEENKSFVKQNMAKIICTAIGFLLALLVVTVGIYKTAFVVVFSVLAYYVGRLLDDKDALRKFIDTYLGR